MQGSKFLKVTGILMIIFGAIALVFSIIALAGVGVLAAMGAPSGLLLGAGLLALLGSVAEFVAGIIGVKNWNTPEKAQTCIVWGFIVIAFCIISNILTLVGYPENFNVISLLTGLVIPVLYLVGAFKNKNMSANAAAAVNVQAAE